MKAFIQRLMSAGSADEVERMVGEMRAELLKAKPGSEKEADAFLETIRKQIGGEGGVV